MVGDGGRFGMLLLRVFGRRGLGLRFGGGGGRGWGMGRWSGELWEGGGVR